MAIHRRRQDVVLLALRWRFRLLRRRFADRRSRVWFARRLAVPPAFDYIAAQYALPLRCYPGQEARFEGKRHNLALALAALDGVVVAPREVLSFWKCAGRPTRRQGYAEAAALKNGQLIEEVGGAICLASTVLYNVGLLSGLTVVERYCHSVDTYGDDRYFELGRDAAVEFAYRDLRFRNDHDASVLMRASFINDLAQIEARFERDPGFEAELCVTQPTDVAVDAFRVHTERVIESTDSVEREDLGWSTYQTPRKTVG